jgi:hypothetical protein
MIKTGIELYTSKYYFCEMISYIYKSKMELHTMLGMLYKCLMEMKRTWVILLDESGMR